jgi:hypothetical protein
MPADPRYCLVGVELPGGQAGEVAGLVRRLLSLPEFATKAARVGKALRVSRRAVECYGGNGRIHVLRPAPDA